MKDMKEGADKTKKAIAYTATAIVLGFAVMMLPLTLKAGSSTFSPQDESLQPCADTLSNEKPSGASGTSRSWGLVSQPSNLLPSSLVLFSGLIVAASAYALFRTRMT